MFTKFLTLLTSMSSFFLSTSQEHLTDFDKSPLSELMLYSFSEKVKRRKSVTGKTHFSKNKPRPKTFRRSCKKYKDTNSKTPFKPVISTETKSVCQRSELSRTCASDEKKASYAGNLPSLLNDIWINTTSIVDRTSPLAINSHVSTNEEKSLDQITEAGETFSRQGTEKGAHFVGKPINKFHRYVPQNTDTDDLSDSNVITSVLEMEEAPLDGYETQRVLENDAKSHDESHVSTQTLFDFVDGDLISAFDDVKNLSESNQPNFSQLKTNTEKMGVDQVDKNRSEKNTNEMINTSTIKSCRTTNQIGENPEEEFPDIITDAKDFKHGIKKALEESIKEKTIHPIIKQELKIKLQLDRVTRGEEELFLDPDEPIEYKVHCIKQMNERKK